LVPYFHRYLFAGVTNGLSVYDINRTIGVSTVVYSAQALIKQQGEDASIHAAMRADARRVYVL